jgi:hypothetical protein
VISVTIDYLPSFCAFISTARRYTGLFLSAKNDILRRCKDTPPLFLEEYVLVQIKKGFAGVRLVANRASLPDITYFHDDTIGEIRFGVDSPR